jgi:hypothetical protein
MQAKVSSVFSMRSTYRVAAAPAPRKGKRGLMAGIPFCVGDAEVRIFLDQHDVQDLLTGVGKRAAILMTLNCGPTNQYAAPHPHHARSSRYRAPPPAAAIDSEFASSIPHLSRGAIMLKAVWARIL